MKPAPIQPGQMYKPSSLANAQNTLKIQVDRNGNKLYESCFSSLNDPLTKYNVTQNARPQDSSKTPSCKTSNPSIERTSSNVSLNQKQSPQVQKQKERIIIQVTHQPSQLSESEIDKKLTDDKKTIDWLMNLQKLSPQIALEQISIFQEQSQLFQDTFKFSSVEIEKLDGIRDLCFPKDCSLQIFDQKKDKILTNLRLQSLLCIPALTITKLKESTKLYKQDQVKLSSDLVKIANEITVKLQEEKLKIIYKRIYQAVAVLQKERTKLEKQKSEYEKERSKAAVAVLPAKPSASFNSYEYIKNKRTNTKNRIHDLEYLRKMSPQNFRQSIQDLLKNPALLKNLFELKDNELLNKTQYETQNYLYLKAGELLSKLKNLLEEEYTSNKEFDLQIEEETQLMQHESNPYDYSIQQDGNKQYEQLFYNQKWLTNTSTANLLYYLTGENKLEQVKHSIPQEHHQLLEIMQKKRTEYPLKSLDDIKEEIIIDSQILTKSQLNESWSGKMIEANLAKSKEKELETTEQLNNLETEVEKFKKKLLEALTDQHLLKKKFPSLLKLQPQIFMKNYATDGAMSVDQKPE